MVLAGVDLGTTHCKAGLFDREGSLIRRASRPTVTHRTAEGYFYHDPEELWQTAASAIHEVVADASGATVEVVGVTSMAEAGVLVDRLTGDARTHVLPWYDARAMEQAEAMFAQMGDEIPEEVRGRRTSVDYYEVAYQQ